MSRISLVIADSDQGYIESIAAFLMCNHAHKFQISSFTTHSSLLKYVSDCDHKIDILMISPELYSEDLPLEKAAALIFLSPGQPAVNVNGVRTINKYQHGDRLVGCILDVYSELDKNAVFISGKGKKTYVTAVYSPVGGSGKSSIAAACSIQCAQRGLSAFYLNLEDIHSTCHFFAGTGEKSFTNVLYHLRENNKNLILKIEGARCIDPTYGVSYFLPPESSRELEEMLPEELTSLIEHFRAAGQYDIVFADMSSNLCKRNLALLEASDEIMLVLTGDEISGNKLKTFKKELDILSQKSNTTIKEKIITIYNKYSSDTSENSLSDIDAGSGIFKIPVIRALTPDHAKDTGNEFGLAISAILDKLACF